jgi:soluble lytic murein transglycosylase-like protein
MSVAAPCHKSVSGTVFLEIPGRVIALLAVVGLLAALPPGAPIPREPDALAARVATTERALAGAVDGWSPTQPPTRKLTLWALYDQRLVIVLTERARTADAVLRRLPASLARRLRNELIARRELRRLSTPRPRGAFRTGPAAPADRLRGYYAEAQRRFHVGWHVLAAVNFVESAFNKLRNSSTAGAQGPMQFIPATWRAYGLGGDVHDPHDAILGAANYLHANGAPRNYARALFHYNPSPSYVDAVLRYARRIKADRRALAELYSRQVFVRTLRGLVRLTGPR